MRRAAFVMSAIVITLIVITFLQVAGAQTPATPLPAQPRTVSPDSVPVRRVILYKNGVGYFEHVGKIRGNQTMTVAFNSSQLNDVLKTLTVLDLGNGRVTGVSYNSEAPLGQRLGGLRLPLGERATLVQLLDALRGARLEVHSGERVVTGRLLSVEQRARTRNGETTTTSEMSLVGDGGDIRVVEITPGVTVRLAERDSTQQVGAYMNLLASSRARDQRLMKIATAGTGERDLLVSYISEVPVWKTTYRIVLPSRESAPQLQAWAVVDNTTGEDWENIELSLVAGAPQSFLQQLSQPLYAQRPVVPLPKSLLLQPQTHQGTLTSGGAGGINGKVSDASGANLPGVSVSLTDGSGRIVARTTTDADGDYEFEGVLPGQYNVVFELAGFSTNQRAGVDVGGGLTTELDSTLNIGSLAETVTVSGERPLRQRSGGFAAGVAGGVLQAAPAPPPPPPPSRSEIEDRIAELQPAAHGSELGDLFEYKISEPISIPRNQSALVPIVRHEIGADRVSVWNARSVDGRPLRSLWLTNSSGLTLDGGSFTVLDAGAFAGEGLVAAMKPGEKRLLSYAVDLGVQVEPRNGSDQRTVRRISIARGLLVQRTEHVAQRAYTIRNNDTTERRVVIEHPIRAGWKLAAANTVTPVETSTDAYRFVVNVPAKQTTTINVAEQQPLDQTYRIADITDQQIDLIVRESGGSTALRSALAPIVAAKAAVAAINTEFGALATEVKRISDDQQRVRENMKTLKGSSEEQQLLKRYTTQLAQQEDRMEALRKQTEDLERRRRDAQAELARLIDSLATAVDVVP